MEVDREALWGEPLEVGEVTITPLAERWMVASEGQRGPRVGGWLRPLGVVIDGPGGTRVLDLDGEELPSRMTPASEPRR